MKKTLVTAAAVLLLAAGTASAQSYVAFQDEWESIVRRAPWTLGPFRLFPAFSLRNVGYDDNIYFENAPRADYTGTFSPELKAYLPIGGTILLSVSDNPEYTYYVKNRARREFTNSVGLGLKALLLSRFVLTGEYQDFAHRRQLSPEIGILVTDLGRAWTAGLHYETASQSAIGLTAFRNELSYESLTLDPEGVPLSQALNRTESGGRAEIYYRAFYKGYLFLGAGLTEYRFQSPDMAWRNSTGRFVTVGARFPVGGSLEGTINFGFKQVKPRAESQAVFSGFVGSADLAARLGRLGLRARFVRDNVFSTFADVLYFVDTTGGGGVSFYITDFLRLDYDFDVGTSDYPASLPGEEPEAGAAMNASRTDRRLNHAAGFVIRILRTAGLGLTWNSAHWTSTIPGWDRRRSFVGAYLTYRF
jgi:hypothetical protein